MKLGHQFAGGAGGSKRLFDTVGAGSRDFGKDGRKENGGWEKGAPGLREKGWRDVGVMVSQGSDAERQTQDCEKKKKAQEYPGLQTSVLKPLGEDPHAQTKTKRGLFHGLCIYINGSTAPLVSDHKLKHLLAENGARISIALGRRSVTHVVLGKPNGKDGGAGGGLSGSKIQKEIQRVRGCGVKFVGVEWVLESVKAGKRLPEARFETLSTAPKGVKSVYGMFKKKESGSKEGEGFGQRADDEG